jgi:hypothetical protein
MPTAAIVGSAVVGAYASNKAAGQQAKGQKKALEAQNALIGPYSDFGKQNLPALQEFAGTGADFSSTQAFKDITNSAKAGGGFNSGNRATALTDYYATNFRPQRFNELFDIARLGSNAAAQQATGSSSLLSGIGASNASGTLGMANSVNSGIQGLTFLNMMKNSGGGVNNASFLGQAGLGG